MVKATKSPKRASGYVLGRHGFSKISAVEGIRLDRRMGEEFSDFDRKALSPKERRAILSDKYGAKR